MDSFERATLLQVLRRVYQNGTAMEIQTWGPTWLPWWKRQVNRILKYLRLPFHDPGNYYECRARRLSELELTRIRSVLFELTPEARCRRCNSPNLDADPAGYYCDAEDACGAPLLCLDHHEKPAEYVWSEPTRSVG